jgi:hypothetical protein
MRALLGGRWWRAGLIATLLLVLAVVTGLGLLLREPQQDRAPHPFNHDRNATWLEHRWLTEPQPTASVEAKLRALSARGVHYVFPHLIPFGRAGRLPPHDREQMRAFLATARVVAPRMRVLPWVGGLRVGYKRTRQGTIDLADLSQRQRIVAECRGLMDEGFDGIHLNIEPVPNRADDLLALLRALRPAIGQSGILSVSVTRPAPYSVPTTRNFLWTPAYYARVATVADQLVVMGYDTALPTRALYQRYMAYVTQAATRALEPDARARVLIGIPTYDATGLMHRARVETIENALLGIVLGLRTSGADGTFEGVAVYADWTTDDAEWLTYERLWRGRSVSAR